MVRKLDFEQFSFAASVGGIFGLCLGASTISLIEVFYFVVIRGFGHVLFNSLANRSNAESIAKATQMDDKLFKKVLWLRNRRIHHNGNPLTSEYKY